MSAFKQAQAQNVLNFTLRPGNETVPTAPIKVRQMSTTPTESTAGTELSGSGFTAGGVTVTFNAPATATGTYSATCGNQSVTLTNAPAGTVNGILLVDSAGSPASLMWGALTAARTLAAGDTLSYPADSIVAKV